MAVAQDWIKQHKEKGVQPVISNPSREVMRLLEKARIPQLIGDEYITVRVNDAVLLCKVATRPRKTLALRTRVVAPADRCLRTLNCLAPALLAV